MSSDLIALRDRVANVLALFQLQRDLHTEVIYSLGLIGDECRARGFNGLADELASITEEGAVIDDWRVAEILEAAEEIVPRVAA